jgi:hypothetical protein
MLQGRDDIHEKIFPKKNVTVYPGVPFFATVQLKPFVSPCQITVEYE